VAAPPADSDRHRRLGGSVAQKELNVGST